MQEEREKMVALLVEHGQNVFVEDYHGYTAIHYASMWGWESTIKLMLDQGIDVNKKNVFGRTALMYAVEFQHFETVEFLLNQNNIHVNAADVNGVTALLLAVETGGDVGFDMAALLIKRGADVNAKTLRKKTALKIACAAQDVKMVNLLLDYKVTVG